MNVPRLVRTKRSQWACLLGALCVLTACSKDDDRPRLTRAELMDPETCKGCHERHYLEWKSSMHAYAAEDPVFLAMNAKGQEDTEGALGDFCVNCHAPMAVREGYTENGLNLDDVPQHLKGVTCYFCHSVAGVGEPKHNNSLELAADNTTMFGPYRNPHSSAPHDAAYAPFFDRDRPEASDMCGACHDIVNQHGVHIERTFKEWQATVYATPGGFSSCASCHMRGRSGLAVSGPDAPSGTPFRDVEYVGVHEHLWAAVDTALTPFPADAPELMEAHRLATLSELEEAAMIFRLDIEQQFGPSGTLVQFWLEAPFTGHSFPSGAAMDRRAWVEMTAYAGDEVIFQSGHVADDEAVLDAEARDEQMEVWRDKVFGPDGEEVHMFWEPAPSTTYPEGHGGRLIEGKPPSLEPHWDIARYFIPGDVMPDRITAVVKIRAVGLDVLEKLYDSGHLRRDQHLPMPTLPLEGTRVEWRAPENGNPNRTYYAPNELRVVGQMIDPCQYTRHFGAACD